MGVDLKLLPLLAHDFWCSHIILGVNGRRELWPKIEALSTQPVPKPLICYEARGKDGDPCYGEVTEDCYGNSLTWLTPTELLTLRDAREVRDNWHNRALWAYLAEMPKDWPIVLYWH
jgi:hypothetical protein